ncbi:heterodisulfide reductase-related iron-sulfur binding cluster [Oceanibaculum sp.]|uniref:heterodisulfide reductase-related iron-sulfur binding cluster n=1 Tax=Oceanibaculum sp. TaxID=1903597 RepID=UPI0025886A52|nr:heterodisulfide reductase-related iron-sulfur binding cluster [Oceanibaculum sp.]MCH2393615.1 glycerol-3-phosphate dehydrogenase [Oceanibaculum sp.]
MKEGSLEAPTRHPLAWTDPDFYDEAKLDEELRRVFDICHGCRRCFNLCDSFPRLFDLIDESESGELDSVSSADFKPVVDACTLCDMCFLTKCPYVPPHEFNLDFPHLMLRYRAVERKKQGTPFVEKQVTETDRNGKLAAPVAGIANWATDLKNGTTRGLMEKAGGIDKRAALPKFHSKTFTRAAKSDVPEVNTAAPAYGRKAALYATCFVNYNNPDTGMAARRVLAKNGVETEVVYPSCCGMPQLEQGDIESVAKKARAVAQEMKPWIDKGYDIVALTPSCALMLKFEWPLIVPDDEDVKRLSAATKDISEYVVDIAKKEGLAEGIQALDGGVTVHIACHARAQNIGQKAAEMLRLIPDTKVSVIERCSGHGGSWGIFKENFDIALKVGKPVARQALKEANKYVVSECPLAGLHILQGMEEIEKDAAIPSQSEHPIELVAKAYGL